MPTRYIGKGKEMVEKIAKKFVFCMVAGDTQTEVHIDGCRDIERGVTIYNKTLGGYSQRAYQDTHAMEGETVEQAIKSEIEVLNADFGDNVWGEEHFTIMPCCRRR